jgi:MoaA/NifB/PqqE/SkfB family radical SAM enzyme
MLYRELTVATDNKLLPCCLYKDDIEVKGSIEETFVSGEFETLRQRMRTGEKIPACEQCYQKEELGLSSLRTESNAKWNNPTNVALKVLELEFDNVCNLKCRSCNSVHSHRWYNDEQHIFGTSLLGKKYRHADDYLNLDFKSLETIKFYGGEPFYSPKCKEFCKHLVNSVDIENLEIVTFSNCTVLPSDEILQVLTNCKSLYLILSIDGYGKFNEYFRSGSKWDAVINSLNFYTELSKKRTGETELLINTTVNIYNANLLDDLDNFIKINYPHIKLQKSALTYPEYLSVANLPKEYKVKLEPYLEKYPDILTYMQQEENTKMFDYFLYFHRSLDKLRNEIVDNLLLTNFIKDYKTNITKEDIKQLIESYVQN